ncbi:uncharacterized protein L201_003877 [Kwoniella dendrophila CBS 6074]|uniref:Uncharacterized protein n=1 Tax=Kwoniella dendrophila CBS 6074 TaxID=1295534 RepID=A0AAX4JWH2_9TREE
MQISAITTFFSFITCLSIIKAAETPYYTLDDVTGTVYYDINDSPECGKNFGDPKWSQTTGMTGPNAAPPICEYVRGKSLSEIGKGTPVAMNFLLVDNDLVNWCGRIVNVYKQNGEPYVLDSGPFYIWDGCGNCATEKKIDFSAEALIGLQDQTSSGIPCDNAKGLKVEVTNQYHWKLAEGGQVNENPTEKDNGSGQYTDPIPSVTTTMGVPPAYSKGGSGSGSGSSQVGGSTNTAVVPGLTTTSSSGSYGSTSLSSPAAGTGVADVNNGGYPASAPGSQASGSGPVAGASTPNQGIPTPSTALPGISSPVGVAGTQASPAGYDTAATSPTAVASAVAGGSAASSPAAGDSTYVPAGKAPSVPIGAGISATAAVGASAGAGAGTSASLPGVNALASPSVPVTPVANIQTHRGTQITGAQEADCKLGQPKCESGQNRICSYFESGSQKIGWIPAGTCSQ